MRIYKHLKALNNPFNLKNILSHLSNEYILPHWAIQLHNLVKTTYVNIISFAQCFFGLCIPRHYGKGDP